LMRPCGGGGTASSPWPRSSGSRGSEDADEAAIAPSSNDGARDGVPAPLIPGARFAARGFAARLQARPAALLVVILLLLVAAVVVAPRITNAVGVNEIVAGTPHSAPSQRPAPFALNQLPLAFFIGPAGSQRPVLQKREPEGEGSHSALELNVNDELLLLLLHLAEPDVLLRRAHAPDVNTHAKPRVEDGAHDVRPDENAGTHKACENTQPNNARRVFCISLAVAKQLRGRHAPT
jgi:hypothetical protein